MSEQRSASQVILELEGKIDNLISMVSSQKLANQLLSNKITELMQQLAKSNQEGVVGGFSSSPKITAEAVDAPAQFPISPLDNFKPTDPEKQIPIYAANKLIDKSDLVGFQRSHRPESFTGDPNYLAPPKQPPISEAQVDFPAYVPKASSPVIPPPGREIESVNNATNVAAKQVYQQPVQQMAPQPIQQENKFVVQNAVPIMQKILDPNGKSIFLAEVEIVNADTSKLVLKTKTKANGKWAASLSPGNYQVVVRKSGSAKTSEMQGVQNITIDGKVSPMEMKPMTIKEVQG